MLYQSYFHKDGKISEIEIKLHTIINKISRNKFFQRRRRYININGRTLSKEIKNAPKFTKNVICLLTGRIKIVTSL